MGCSDMSRFMNSMMVKDAIYGRRSIRSYKKEPIDRRVLAELLAAAVQAPTAMHAEPWQFAIVEDAKLLKRLSDLAKASCVAEIARLYPDHAGLKSFSQPDFNVFYDAPTLIVICSASNVPLAIADCWLAAQNLMLGAHAMGLGTCVIGSAAKALNSPHIKLELDIPPETTAVAPIIIGTPRGDHPPGARSEPRILSRL